MPRTTLTIEGLPDGDEANTVTVKYTKPVADSSAWLTDTFTAIHEDVETGLEPIISTALDLPGVYRKEEASNKAIIKLNRVRERFRISFIAIDEGIMFQPGDVLELNDSNRGISGLEIFVESAVMIDYGRWRITGTRYRDTDYSNECYVDEDGYGKWVDILGPPIIYNTTGYSCNAYYNFINQTATPVLWWPYTQGGPTPSLGNNDEVIEVVRGSNLIIDTPYSENNPETIVPFTHCDGAYFWGDDYDGVGDKSNHLFTGDTGARVSSTGFWYSVIQVGWGGANSSGLAFDIKDGTYTYRFSIFANGSALWFGAPMTGNPTQITSVNSITGTNPANAAVQINHFVVHYKNPSAGASPGALGEIDVYAGGKLIYTKGSNLVTSIRTSTWRVENISAGVALQGARAHVMIGDGEPDVSGMWNAFKRNFPTAGSPLPYYQP